MEPDTKLPTLPLWCGERVSMLTERGRRVYITEFKRWIVYHAMKPGMSLSALARNNQVTTRELRRWMQLYGQQDVSSSPVSRVHRPMITYSDRSPRAVQTDPVAAEIELAGVVVRVRNGVNPTTLRLIFYCLQGPTR